jgi:hypothetical protein
MAFQGLRRIPITHQSRACELAPHAGSKEGTWQKAAFEFVGTFCVLMGVALSVLTLRFVLVLIHSLH